METIFPDDGEIKLCKAKFGGIENILNDKVECTICKYELMSEIILKKLIMVHRIYLVICCPNCFYKLCDVNDFSCILCKSNEELSNCEKCDFNVCERCVKIHEIDKISNGVLTKCFGCQPRMLWKQRAQTSNVLKVFSSQLDMPNGLLVNDIKYEQPVRNYLIEKAKNGQNSKSDNIRNQLCLDFFLSSFKSTVIEKITTFSPSNGDNISIEEHSNEFFQNSQNVMENTFSILTNFKKVFNLNSQLNPGVCAMMKSLLKTFDNEHVPGNSKIKENKNEANLSLNMSNTRCLKSSISSSSTNVQPGTNQVDRDAKVVIEHSGDSILAEKMDNASSNVDVDMEINERIQLIDLSNDNSRSKEENTRKLRRRKVIKNNEKATSNLSNKCDSTPIVTRSKLSRFKMSLTSNGSESDSRSEKKVYGTKRKLKSSTTI